MKRMAAATVVLIAAVAVGGYLFITRGFSAREEPSSLERLVATTARALAVPRSAKVLSNPVALSQAVIDSARAHFTDHCFICHANDGSGNTTIGRNMYPKAPDMRLPATQERTDGELYYTIYNGVRLTGMPAWGGEDDDEEIWALVHFIRRLPRLAPEELEEMKRLNPRNPSQMDMRNVEPSKEQAPHGH